MDHDDLLPDGVSESSYVPSEDEMENPRQYLQQFLNWKPAPLVGSHAHTKSNATKHPMRFDLHMHDLLKLKKVELLPDLPKRLSLICDEYISNENASYLGLGNVYESKFERVIQHQNSETEIGSQEDGKIYYEASVVQAVGMITGEPCSIVSSTLLFDLPSWKPVLSWSQKPVSAVNKGFAQADAFVYVDRKLANSQLSDQHKDHVDLIYQFGLQNFLLWEFKNLKAGGPEVMAQILAQAEEPAFRWTTCKSGQLVSEEVDDAMDCNHEHHSVEGEWAITGHNVGLDATDPKLVMHIPLGSGAAALASVQADSAADRPSEYNLHDADCQYTAETRDNFDTIYEDTEYSTTSQYVDAEGLCSSPSRATKRSSACDSSLSALDRPSPSKKSKNDLASASENMGKNSLAEDSNTQRKHALGKKADRTKARHILQQAWAEMVNNDATYLVISSGNLEIIAMRNRETQTMYLSPILEPPEDTDIPHTKLMTSLFITAYRDAIDRAIQMNTMTASPRKTWSPHLRLLFDKAGNMIDQDADPSVNKREAINAELSTAVRNAGYLMCNLPNSLSGLTKQKHGYCRPHNISALRNIANKSDAGMSLWLSVKSPATIQGARIVRYTLTRAQSVNGRQSLQCYSGDLMMKFAETLDDKRRLEHEYRTYEVLLAKGVRHLPKMFGVFSFDANRSVLGLLMENCGFNLAYWREQIVGQKMIERNKKVIMEALDIFHRSGYIHGSIIADHVLITSTGKPYVISLSRCSEFSGSATQPLKKSLSAGPGPMSYSDSTKSSAIKTDADRRAEVGQLQKLLIPDRSPALEIVVEEDIRENIPVAGPSHSS